MNSGTEAIEDDAILVHNFEFLKIMQTGFQELWETSLLSDISLQAEGTTFAAHRPVLAAASPFFMAMFTGVWTEAGVNKQEVDMKGVSAIGLKHILQYIYTGKLAFKPSDTADVMIAADHLQIMPVINHCAQFMEENIDIDNCVDVLNIAQLHNMDDLENAACDFIKRHFQKVLQCKCHVQLKLADFLYFLDGEQNGEDVLELGSEIDVFNAVLEWLRHDEAERMRYAVQAMETVRFPLLSYKEVSAILRDIPLMSINPECNKLIVDALSYLSSPIEKRIMVKSKNTRIRNRESVLLTSPIQFKCDAYVLSPHHILLQDPKYEKWIRLQNFPTLDFELDYLVGDMCTIEVNGFLIVLVVQTSCWVTLDSENVAKLSIFAFDPRQYQWSALKGYEMTDEQLITTAVVSQDELFVFMKQADRPAEILAFSFDSNTWKHQGYMIPKFLKYSVCSFGEQIFVFGIRPGSSSVTCYIYSPGEQSWTEKASGANSIGLEKSQAFIFTDQILHSGVDDFISLDIYRINDDTWNTLWLSEGFSDLTTECIQVMCGDNLFFLNDPKVKPYSTELTLGRKFCEVGRKFIKHEVLPIDLQPGCLTVSIRIPKQKLFQH